VQLLMMVSASCANLTHPPWHCACAKYADDCVCDLGGLARQFEGAWGRPTGPSSLTDEFLQQQQHGQQRPGMLPPLPQHLQPGFPPAVPPALGPQGIASQIAQPFLQVSTTAPAGLQRQRPHPCKLTS
jgi:hypothetical protein